MKNRRNNKSQMNCLTLLLSAVTVLFSRVALRPFMLSLVSATKQVIFFDTLSSPLMSSSRHISLQQFVLPQLKKKKRRILLLSVIELKQSRLQPSLRAKIELDKGYTTYRICKGEDPFSTIIIMHFEGRPASGVIQRFMIRIWCGKCLQFFQINRQAFQQVTKQSVILSVPQQYVQFHRRRHCTPLYIFTRIFLFYTPLGTRLAWQLPNTP